MLHGAELWIAQIGSSWRNTMVITNQNQVVQLGITDMTLGSGEKPSRGTEVLKSQVSWKPRDNF